MYLLDESGQAYTNWPLPRVWQPDRGSKREGWQRLRKLATLLLSAFAVLIGLVVLLLLCWWLLAASAPRKLSNQIKMTATTAMATTQTMTTNFPVIEGTLNIHLPNPDTNTQPGTTTTAETTIPTNNTLATIKMTTAFQLSAGNTTISPRLAATTTAYSPQQRLHFSTQKAAASLVGRHRKLQLQKQQHKHRVIQVTLPAKPFEFDRMEVKGNEEAQRFWAQLNNGNVTGRMPTTTTIAMGTTTTNTTIPTSTQTALVEEEGTKEDQEGEEEEDDDDLYWPRPHPLPPNQAMSPTIHQKSWVDDASSSLSAASDGYEAGRPTIAFGPVRAKAENESGKHEEGVDNIEMLQKDAEEKKLAAEQIVVDVEEAERRRISEKPANIDTSNNSNGITEGQEQQQQQQDEQEQSAHTVAMIQAELNDIIASVEREEQQQQRQRQHHSVSPVAPPSFSPYSSSDAAASSTSLEIRPVEIPFDESAGIQPPVHSPPNDWLENVPEPVWRRPPPGIAPAPPPPPPPLPPSSTVNTNNLPAMPKSDLLKGKELAKQRQTLWRRRREAPVMVTALLDIGRGQWQRFTRHFDQYLGYLTNILSRVQNNIVLFGDTSVVAYLREMRENGTLPKGTMDWERIQIVEISLRELPFYKERQQINAIIEREQTDWKPHWDAQMRAHPESLYADYDILVNSKPYFLYNATQISRFPRPVTGRQRFFAWLDAGYGHGSAAAIPEGVWTPQLRADQITLVQLPSGVERVERYTLEKIYRKQRSVVSGGFLAGDERVIRRFWTFFFKTFMELLGQEKVDDDQTTLLVTIQRYNSTFHLLRGGWFDAFKLLPTTTNTTTTTSASASVA